MDIKTTSNSPYMYTNEGTPEMDILSAASIGDLGMVSQILQKGFEVDQRNESGWTALMYAANFGHYNVIKLLIDHGSSVNAQEWIQGRSPLMLAASCGHTRCLEVLIALGGADVDMVDFQGRNAAYYAIHSGHGRNKIIAKLLRIQPKPRSISRSRPMATVSRSINPDIVISSENEIVSNTSYQPSTRWASGLGTSPYSKSSKTTELTSFYSPLQSIGNRDNSTSYANEIPSTPSPTNQLYKSLTTPHGGIHSASSFSSSSYHQNHCCTFTPNSIGSDMRKRRLAMQSGGDRFSNIPSKASRGYDIVSAMDKTSNHDCGYDQSYHHHQLAESQLTMINAIAANVVGAVSKTANASPNGVSPKKVENGQDTSDDSAQVSNGERSSDGDIGDPQSDQKSDQSLQPPPSSSSTSNGCTQSPISSNTSQSSDTGISGSNESSQIISSPSNCNNASGSGDGKTSSPITLDCTSNSRSPLPENLDDLLERIGLSQYSSIFATHGIDLYVFLTLEDSDLVSLGITIHGHRRKMHLAQLRFRESVEITSSQERFLADWLLSEREYLKKENHELRKRIQTLTAMAQ